MITKILKNNGSTKKVKAQIIKEMEQKIVQNRLLIIGNGFDLDLGRKTRYSDFAKSEFWLKNLDSQLYGYLNKKSQIERWFNLDGELAT